MCWNDSGWGTEHESSWGVWNNPKKVRLRYVLRSILSGRIVLIDTEQTRLRDTLIDSSKKQTRVRKLQIIGMKTAPLIRYSRILTPRSRKLKVQPKSKDPAFCNLVHAPPDRYNPGTLSILSSCLRDPLYRISLLRCEWNLSYFSGS